MTEKFNNKRLIFSAVLFFSLIIVLGIILLNHKTQNYNDTIEDWREQKDEYFLNNPESPLENKDSFKGLNYYPPNKSFKVMAHIERNKDSLIVNINKNDGRKEKYLEYGIAKFKFKKNEYNLTLYKLLQDEENSNLLFLPFSDRTNDETTYIGGRYLDIELLDSAKAEIDFNKAYNPYCAYNPRFSCPMPPQKNYLDIEILAGEKSFTTKQSQEKDSTDSK